MDSKEPTGRRERPDDAVLEPGEVASLRVAGTNDPEPTAGATLTIRFVRNGHQIAVVETTVES